MSRVSCFFVATVLIVSSAWARNPVPVVNTGVSIARNAIFSLEQEHVFYALQENDLSLDLNDDGDLWDPVLHLLDLRTGVTTNLGLAGYWNNFLWQRAYRGDLAAFTVFELYQGVTDLNGDGDAGDRVVHVYDAKLGEIRNLGLAGSGQTFLGLDLAFGVSESGQGGSDLNGDGDALDWVLHVLSAESGVVSNFLVDADLNTGFVPYQDRFLSFLVREPFQGGQDLNDDGDSDDWVLHVLDAETSTALNLQLASPQLGFFGTLFEHLAFLVFEMDHGSTDLNGDGDAVDYVLHVFDEKTLAARNLGLAVDRISLRDFKGHLLAWRVKEESQGNSDLNGDGDTGDQVFHVYNKDTDLVTNLGLAGGIVDVSGDFVVFTVSEGKQGGLDLNGDGDAIDLVPFFWDSSSGTIHNFALQHSVLWGADDAFAVVSVWEPSGPIDLNGDGDTTDIVLHVLELETRIVANTGVAAYPYLLALSDERLVFPVDESQEQKDLNRDDDASDVVLHIFDARLNVLRNIELAIEDPLRIEGDRMVFPVSEAAQGQKDLNDDGDTDDQVLHTLLLSTTPERRLLALTEDLQRLVADGDVDGQVGSFLETYLEQAMQAMREGDDVTAAHLLTWFRFWVRLGMFFGLVSTEAGQGLVDGASVIIDQIVGDRPNS